ncbi:MAG: elongation factor G [Planctomycetes bacterium]|nr:elongation factor G [Planctomycetota bacterium]
MGARAVGDIRNIALVGHSAAGKTTLGEALLLKTGATNRLGSVDDGSSLLDFDDESKERKQSVDSAAFFIERNGKLINLIDTPGMPDYCGLAISALSGVDTAAIVISAASGIGVNTRRMFHMAGDFGLARMIIVTRIDAENADLAELVNGIRETFGGECHPVNLPADGGKRVIDVLTIEEGAADVLDVKQCHTELLESIVETDDSLMDEYMSTGAVHYEKIDPAIEKAVASGHVVPILFVNAKTGVGIEEVLDTFVHFAPPPEFGKPRELITGEGESEKRTALAADPARDFVAQVFKITSDPKSNIKYCLARVLQGCLKPDGQVFPSGDRKGQRPGHILKLRGNQQSEIPEASAGDIVAFAKLDLAIGTTIFAKSNEGRIARPKLPTPMFALAIEPKSRGDIEKISGALHRFAEEDPCFQYHRDNETNELVINGLGDMHLTVIRSKMKRYYKAEVDTKPPKIPYRETIVGKATYVEYTHKKQSGGAGQFAKVAIDIEPNERGKGYEFVDKIFGGAIDLSFRPSVDKGVRDQMKRGVIAGCQVVDVKVSLVDGKTHPVDSKDIAFQIAGRQVFKKAFTSAKPILLEPIVSMEVTVPAGNVGDITRDLSGKRGQIINQDMLPGNQMVIKATVPLSEVTTYSSQLKSVTGGQGSYSMELSHYDVVPPNVQQQIMAAYKPHGDDDE